MTIRTTAPADETPVIGTIALAFSADPIWRWCWPDPDTYAATAPRVVRAFAGQAFRHDGAYCSDDYAAACLWLRPDVHPDDEALADIFLGTISETVRKDLKEVLKQMAMCRPMDSHWYLSMIGVDPLRQGQGYGSALMEFALQDCDREHLAAYLESTNPRNVSLYERLGFKAVRTVQSGSSPAIVPMYRSPR